MVTRRMRLVRVMIVAFAVVMMLVSVSMPGRSGIGYSRICIMSFCEEVDLYVNDLKREKGNQEQRRSSPNGRRISKFGLSLRLNHFTALLRHNSQNPCKSVERVKGIEPSSRAWEAYVLPLNHTRTRLHMS